MCFRPTAVELNKKCPECGRSCEPNLSACPDCGAATEVWSRVVGYLRPVQNFHKGKKEEYRQRVKYVIKEGELSEAAAQ